MPWRWSSSLHHRRQSPDAGFLCILILNSLSSLFRCVELENIVQNDKTMSKKEWNRLVCPSPLQTISARRMWNLQVLNVIFSFLRFYQITFFFIACISIKSNYWSCWILSLLFGYIELCLINSLQISYLVHGIFVDHLNSGILIRL